jgi:hypothetical protein
MINTFGVLRRQPKSRGFVTMNSTFNPTFEDAILTTNGDQLKPIKVGIIGEDGSVLEVITLEELARYGCNQEIFMHNYAQTGEVECEFTVCAKADKLLTKMVHFRQQQRTQKSTN